MLHHVSVGVLDMERALRFYDSVLGTLGYKRVMEILPYGVAYGTNNPEFWVGPPHDHHAASAGNGVHVAFNAKSKRMIESFHRAALQAGGTDEGAAGPRPDYGPDYFGAFVRDPDGNKLEAVLAPDPVVAKKQAPADKAKRKPQAKAKTNRRTTSKPKAKAKKSKARAKKVKRKTRRK